MVERISSYTQRVRQNCLKIHSMTDSVDQKLTNIIVRIQGSALTDSQKADAYASIHNGLHKLVWPILLSHIPESDLKDAVDHPETMTVARPVRRTYG